MEPHRGMRYLLPGEGHGPGRAWAGMPYKAYWRFLCVTGRPPKEAQNTAPVQQIQPARGPRLESLLEPQWLRMWMMLLLVMCVMVVMVMSL